MAKISDEEIKRLLETQQRYKIPDFPDLPGGIETLLNIPGRKELPAFQDECAGRPVKLVQLVNECPGTYSELIGRLLKGQYYHVAAAAVGIGYSTIKAWIAKGKIDIENDEDTYYSRFVQDVGRAVAQCRGNIEEVLTQIDPKRWLSQGPGKMFGTEWAENKTEEIVVSDNPLLITTQEQIQEHIGGMKIKILELDDDTTKIVNDELDVIKKRQEKNNAIVDEKA